MAERLETFEIPELTYGEHCIRIDWLGSVQRQVNQQDREAFQVNVIASVLNSPRDLTVRSDVSQKCIAISIDALPALWIGSLWKNGRRLKRGGYPRQHTRQLLLDSSEDQWVALAGTKAPESGKVDYPIPTWDLQITRVGNWKYVSDTQLLKTHTIDGTTVLIPAIELIRFYACPSSLLTRKLFAGQWPSLEYQPHSSPDIINGVATIGVDNMKGVDFESALYLARYKFSEHMRSSVNLVGQYLSVAGRRKESLLRFNFPFNRSQPTPLVCDVVPLGKQGNRYLVTRIIQCEQPFPFSKLNVDPMVNPEKVHVANPDELKPMTIPRNRVGSPAYSDKDSSSGSPLDNSTISIAPALPNAITEISQFVDAQSRFTAIGRDDIQLTSSKQRQQFKHVAGVIVTPFDPNVSISTNPGKGSAGTIVEGQIKTSYAEPVPSDPITLDLLMKALDELRSQKFKTQIKSVRTNFGPTIDQQTYKVVYVVPLRRYAGKHGKWHRTDANKEKGEVARSRYLLLSHIEFNNGAQYLVGEIERIRNDECFSVFCSKIPWEKRDGIDELALELSKQVANKKGWPLWEPTSSTYALDDSTTLHGKRLIHTKGLASAQEYARRIVGLEM